MAARRILLGDEPVASLDEYRARGGGSGLAAADRLGPDGVVGMVRASGLRGRGGAGFPAGVKWAGLRGGERGRRSVVCNAAEGEPGTYKDRWLMRQNPYQILEGLAIAAYAVGAERAYIGVKAKFVDEIERITTAAAEMDAAGLLADVPVVIVPGPDDYLFGEEKGLLEVIEGRDPLPRLYPPYVMGLFANGAAAPGDDANPAVVNNVETLCNVPHIVASGADWFKSFGTEQSPGTKVVSVSGDVRKPGNYEVELGIPVRKLINGLAGGTVGRRKIKGFFPGGSSAPVLTDEEGLDLPYSFEAMAEAGSMLGSGSIIVFDERTNVVELALRTARFYHHESCGKCTPCREGTNWTVKVLERLIRGEATPIDLETIAGVQKSIIGNCLCVLGDSMAMPVGSMIEKFRPEFDEALEKGVPMALAA